MGTTTPIQSNDTIDVKRYLFKLLSGWYWLVLGSLVGYTAALLVNRYTEPIYGVSTTIELSIDDKTTYFDKSLIEGLSIMKKQKNIENEISILKSYDLHSQVIKQLNFDITYIGMGRIRNDEVYKNGAFYIDYDTTFNQKKETPFYLTFNSQESIKVFFESLDETVVVNFNEWIENRHFRFRIVPIDYEKINSIILKKYEIWFNNTESLIQQYSSQLYITTLSDEGTILNLFSSGRVAEKEIDYLNTLTDLYIKRDLEEKNRIITNAIDFIDQQLSDITDSLYNTEIKLQNFKLENEVIDISREGQTLLTKYEALQTEKDQEVVKHKYLEYLKQQLTDRGNKLTIIAPGVAGINDPVLTNIITQINQSKSEKQSLEFSARKDIMPIKILEQKILNLEAGLEMNVNSLLEQVNIRIIDLDKRIANVALDLKRQPVNERLLLNIKRKFTLNDNIYTYLLEKRAEAGIKKASILSDAKVLDAAGLSGITKLYPKTKQNLVVGVFIGIMIPVLLIFLFDYMNVRIVDRKEVEENTNVPILGGIGHNTSQQEHVVINKPRSSISESFRSLKTNIQFVLGNHRNSIILITSGVSGEGKTFCSTNLGGVYASLNKKTVILGLDFRRPKLHENFGISNEVGMTNYLTNNAELKDIIIKTKIENLDVIPAGPTPPNPNQLVESQELKDLLELLKTMYEIVILDTPPVALVSDAIYLSTISDVNIFVIRVGYTTRHIFNLLNELYDNKGIKNMLIALNDVKSQGYYGYGNYGGRYDYGSYGENRVYYTYYDDPPPSKPWIERLVDRIKNKR